MFVDKRVILGHDNVKQNFITCKLFKDLGHFQCNYIIVQEIAIIIYDNSQKSTNKKTFNQKNHETYFLKKDIEFK